MERKQNLQKLFAPRAVTVVGASAQRGKLGNAVLRNIASSGYTGKIYPINPHNKEIEWLKCYPAVTKVPGEIDVAVILVPASAVVEVVESCGRKKIPYVAVISAGFKESGVEGAEDEAELVRICHKYRIRLVGPNCLGYLNTAQNLNASFASSMPRTGNVALVSQSGAMGAAMLDWALASQLGFSKIISIGNKADLDEVDFLKYLSDDPQTQVIMMYLESITDGVELMKVASRVVPKKPVVVLKAGSSQQARQAVLSHTGSLTGSHQAMLAAFHKVGIIYTRTIEEFFDVGMAFSQQPVPRGNRMAVITNAGGPGIMTVDAATGLHVKFPVLEPQLRRKLQEKLPTSANTANPIDLIGDALPDRYEHALRTVLRSRYIDGVIVILTPQIMTQEDETAKIIGRLQKKYHKPVLASFLGGRVVQSGRDFLEVHKIPQYDTPERAVRAMDHLICYAQRQREDFERRLSHHRVLWSRRSVQHAKQLPPYGHHVQIRTMEAENILQKYHLPVVSSQLLYTPQDCAKIKKFPAVMKVASRTVVHKSAAQAVVTNIMNAAEAERAWRRIERLVRREFPHAEIEGMLVQEQVPEGREVIIGMKRDASFGPIIMFGLGGTIVEVFHDVSFGVAPITSVEAEEMVSKIHTAPLLHGYDLQPVIRAIIAVGEISLTYPAISELDMNPLILYPVTCSGKIVDVRMMTVAQ